MLPRKIKVLVVDDSAVVRRLVSEALEADDDIDVVGTAINPYAAREKILSLTPDVITLDLEMPRMDGLTFLRILMEQRPMPVIIMSSLTQSGSEHALEALRLGAIDVLGKPGGSYSFGDLGPLLVQKVKAAAGARVRQLKPAPNLEKTAPPAAPSTKTTPAFPVKSEVTPAPAKPAEPAPVRESLPASASFPPQTAEGRAQRSVFAYASSGATRPAETIGPTPPAYIKRGDPRSIILLGASTGGTEALRDVISRIPNGLPPIAIVQHIPATFSKAFADRLNTLTQCQVREAVDGDILRPGLVLIAPGNFHLALRWENTHYRARVVEGPPVWHQRPAVDILFKSAADCGAGPHCIAGILTGMGKDGAEGLLKLREKGAITFSQDEASSVVYGMPRAAWENGASLQQLALDRVPDFVLRHVASATAMSASRPPFPH